MSHMLKAKLVIMALCIGVVAGANLYQKGMVDGIASLDQEAFESYTHFAKQMQTESKPKKVRVASVWEAVDGNR